MTPRLDQFDRRRAAFTLWELVLVMLILAIIAAVAVPTMREFGRGRTGRNVATEILALAHWGRAQAIGRGVRFRLNFNPNAGAYWLTQESAPGLEFVPVSEEFGRIFTAPDGVIVEWDGGQGASDPFVEFDPSGRTGPAPSSIRVHDERGEITVLSCPSTAELFRIEQPSVQQ